MVVGCQKTTTAPPVSGAAALTVVDAIPNTGLVIPVLNSSSAVVYFGNAMNIGYGGFNEYSTIVGNDTAYVVQDNGDTLNFGPKGTNLLFDEILSLKAGGIYSLLLCGADTTSTDYLFTTDSLPYHGPTDSLLGIRFVNLSAGSNPISINLEGSSNGSVISRLPYKSITAFNSYLCNSATQDYFFVIRDATTGDSLTQFDFLLSGSTNNGYGLTDPNTGNLLTFKNVTIAIYGSETNANFPLSTLFIEDFFY